MQKSSLTIKVNGELRRKSFAPSAKQIQKGSENDEQVSLQPCDYYTILIIVISCFAQNTERAYLRISIALDANGAIGHREHFQ